VFWSTTISENSHAMMSPRREAPQNEADETVAIATVNAAIYVDILGMLVVGLLKIIDNELSLPGHLTWK
jgi:hypothetical protein